MSIPESMEHTVNTGLLYEYCHGIKPFPCDSFRRNGASENGIDFVKSLMLVNPAERSTAALALASLCLAQTSSTSAVADMMNK